jgi:AcrR family transcriptional regulator
MGLPFEKHGRTKWALSKAGKTRVFCQFYRTESVVTKDCMAQKKTKKEQNTETPNVSNLSARDRILRTAMDLFYAHGIRAVGVDRIIAESGVAKMTLYKHFPSKSALVIEYLKYKDDKWLTAIERIANDGNKSALERLLALFDVMGKVIGVPDYQGCPFIRTLAEFGSDDGVPEIQKQLASHFSETRDAITRMVRDVNPKVRPDTIVQIVMTLLTGILVVAQVDKRGQVARVNKEAARTLLEAFARQKMIDRHRG